MYSVTNLTTIADCDVLLTLENKEKADLTFKKMSEERLVTNYSSTAVEIDAVLQRVIAEIAAVDTVLTVLPEGSTKEAEEKRKVRLEYKKFLLENRKESYGTVALLEKELDLERVNRQIAEVDVFIAEITAHKATLLYYFKTKNRFFLNRFFSFYILNRINLRSRQNEHSLSVLPNRHTFLQLHYSSLVVHRNRIRYLPVLHGFSNDCQLLHCE